MVGLQGGVLAHSVDWLWVLEDEENWNSYSGAMIEEILENWIVADSMCFLEIVNITTMYVQGS